MMKMLLMLLIRRRQLRGRRNRFDIVQFSIEKKGFWGFGVLGFWGLDYLGLKVKRSEV